MKYLKLFEDFESRVFNFTEDYKNNKPINHSAKPGERIIIEPDFSWINGDVYLTQENDVSYHGGLIDNIADNVEDYIKKKGGLYLTRSLLAASNWYGGVTTGKRPPLTRVYEVKIKKNSLFINSSPAAQDPNGLFDESNALKPMGIMGMSDNNFRHNQHKNQEGTTGSEGLIINSDAIESFRAIPFNELLRYFEKNPENFNSSLVNSLKSNLSGWYEIIKKSVANKYFSKEWGLFKKDFKLKAKERNLIFIDDGWDLVFYKDPITGKEVHDSEEFFQTYSKEIDDKINSLTNKEIIEIQSQDNRTKNGWLRYIEK
jgi:hypothetical protein